MKTSKVSVLGSGPIGLWAASSAFDNPGTQVTVLNRSGKPPRWLPANLRAPGDRLKWAAVDVLDKDSVRAATGGADLIIHAVNPLYFEWKTILPVMNRNIIDAALANNSRLVSAENLYMYEHSPQTPFTEASPMNPPSKKGQYRKECYEEALRAVRERGLQFASIRASDYFGPGSTFQSHFGDRFLEPVLKGKSPTFVGSTELPHAWAYVPDFGKALFELGSSDDPELWGRAWILPHTTEVSAHAMSDAILAVMLEQGLIAALPSGKVGAYSRGTMKFLGLFSRMIREVVEMLYQFENSFTVDSSAFEAKTGFKATSLDVAAAELVKFWKETRK